MDSHILIIQLIFLPLSLSRPLSFSVISLEREYAQTVLRQAVVP